jgi:hypothetical protein
LDHRDVAAVSADAGFWSAFMDWHVRTEHPWDLALHMEAMSLSIEGFSRELGEVLRPAVDRAAEAIRAFGDAYSKAFPA